MPRVRLTMTENTRSYILNLHSGIPSHETASHFSMENFSIAAGSACSKSESSHVSLAAGLPKEAPDSVLRISFCKYNTPEELGLLCRS